MLFRISNKENYIYSKKSTTNSAHISWRERHKPRGEWGGRCEINLAPVPILRVAYTSHQLRMVLVYCGAKYADQDIVSLSLALLLLEKQTIRKDTSHYPLSRQNVLTSLGCVNLPNGTHRCKQISNIPYHK